MQGEKRSPQDSCSDKAAPAKKMGDKKIDTLVDPSAAQHPCAASKVPPRKNKPAPVTVEPPLKAALSDVVLADVMLADIKLAMPPAVKANPGEAASPAELSLPATLSNTSWKHKQNLPLTIIIPPTPWSDSPVYEHAVALHVVPETWRTRLFGKREKPRSRYLPCWLTSFVLHMAVIIILGSLASPPARQFASNGIQLLISSTTQRDATADLVTFETGPRQDPLPNKSQSPVQTAPKISLQDPFDKSAENLPAKMPPINLAIQRPGMPTGDVAPPKPAVKSNPTNAATNQAAAIVSRLTPTFGAEPARLDTAPLANRPIDEKQMDDVVDRFTRYDIGNLPGEAGERARRDFDALGPEAIPALVRGLNRAAQLANSCPVLVISRKLDRSLEANRDPTSFRYALDNLGRDVPKNAQHIEVLKKLKEKWLTKTPPAAVEHDPQQLADIVIAHGIPVSDRLRQRMDRLSRASTDTLSRALAGNDKDDPLAATAILIQRQGEIPDHLKPKLIRGLIRQLKNEGTRLATCKALALLIDYANYAPRTPPQVGFGEKPGAATKPLDAPAEKLVQWAQRMELFEGPLPPYRRYRPIVVEFLDATNANIPEATASK